MPAGSGGGDAITAARFSLTIDGVEIAQFSELVGILSEAGSDDLAGRILKKLPGKTKPPTVALRRALTADTQIAAWHDAALDGELSAARKSATLVMYATDGNPVAKFHLESAWPAKLEIGALGAERDDVLYEAVTLACERIRRVAP
jgi:phage tail-like protein